MSASKQSSKRCRHFTGSNFLVEEMFHQTSIEQPREMCVTAETQFSVLAPVEDVKGFFPTHLPCPGLDVEMDIEFQLDSRVLGQESLERERSSSGGV
jgi:hypothetical protein